VPFRLFAPRRKLRLFPPAPSALLNMAGNCPATFMHVDVLDGYFLLARCLIFASSIQPLSPNLGLDKSRFAAERD
jgi:hypothetical protein